MKVQGGRNFIVTSSEATASDLFSVQVPFWIRLSESLSSEAKTQMKDRSECNLTDLIWCDLKEIRGLNKQMSLISQRRCVSLSVTQPWVGDTCGSQYILAEAVDEWEAMTRIYEVRSGSLCQANVDWSSGRCRFRNPHRSTLGVVWLGAGTDKSGDDGEEGGRMKPCSWAKKCGKLPTKAQENWEGWVRSSGTVPSPVRGRPPPS